MTGTIGLNKNLSIFYNLILLLTILNQVSYLTLTATNHYRRSFDVTQRTHLFITVFQKLRFSF